jgi:hypothetical protein
MLLIRCHLNQQVKLFCSLHIWSFLLLILTKKKKKMSRNPSKLDRELSFLLLIYLVHAHVRRGGGNCTILSKFGSIFRFYNLYFSPLCFSKSHPIFNHSTCCTKYSHQNIWNKIFLLLLRVISKAIIIKIKSL